MSITHPNFLTQVRSYAEVDSNVLTDTLIDQFIRNTELDIAGKVDYDDLRKYATSNFNANKRFLQMPSGFLYIRSLQVFADSNLTSARTFMQKKDTSFITEFNGSGATGQPKYYANWDDASVVVAPTPDQAYATQLNYVINPPHFDNTTNTFISTYQEALLLYGVLVETFSYLKGPMDMYNIYKTRYDKAIEAFSLQQTGKRRRAEYDDGVPRIVVPSPSPNTKKII
jgi:hypothetical protein|tara:strand:- start:236 stop:916 length:681 start_codon:yes stop_codon:yes gene_type:complete